MDAALPKLSSNLATSSSPKDLPDQTAMSSSGILPKWVKRCVAPSGRFVDWFSFKLCTLSRLAIPAVLVTAKQLEFRDLGSRLGLAKLANDLLSVNRGSFIGVLLIGKLWFRPSVLHFEGLRSEFRGPGHRAGATGSLFPGSGFTEKGRSRIFLRQCRYRDVARPLNVHRGIIPSYRGFRGR